MKRQLLIVEDDENLGWALKEKLETEGYEVAWAQSLQAAKGSLADSTADSPDSIRKSQFDLIILDWMLPDGQGHDFLKAIRQEGCKVPVIFLTAKVELMDKIIGLEMGANDYMTKPFEIRELLARIRVQLRDGEEFENHLKQHQRVMPQPARSLQVGDLCILKDQFRVTYQHRAIDLVKKEFDLLVLLAESAGKVFSRDEILNKVWGYDVYPTTRTVDTHVMLLRQKLSEDLIETVRSVGYRFKSSL